MAYQLDRFNGAFLVNVEDGSIESNATDLRFVGKNYAGYGEVQNENFLHLLENFANISPPPKVISGQIWYDNANKKLKFYDGTRFRSAGGSEVGSIAPAGLAVGEFWFDTSAKQLYAWTGTDFLLIGPEASPEIGSAAATSQIVKDTLGNNHSILKLSAGGKTVVIINQDEDFTLDNTLNPIEDFTIIKKGLNLVKTNTSGVSTDNYIFWGSASNSLRLGGISADQFLLKGDVNFVQQISFRDPGFLVGEDGDLRVRVEGGDEVVFENRLGNDLTFRITDPSSNESRNIGIFTFNGFIPGDNVSYNLGSSLSRWNDVYASTIYGNLVGNVTGNFVGSNRGSLLADDTTVLVDAQTKQIGYAGANIVGTLTGSVQGDVIGTSSNSNFLDSKAPSLNIPTSSVETIPVRSSTGDIIANRFIGLTDRADRLKIDNSASDTDPNYRSAKTTPVANSIAARNSSGNLEAVIFEGTATAARYADLAEKYVPDRDYGVGTVVSIGGEKEVTSSMFGDRAIGVVSANPAYMMNCELKDGIYIALKGRVPVKVIGPVKKKDRLVAADNGCAITATEHQYYDVFAVALEDHEESDVKLIEAVIL